MKFDEQYFSKFEFTKEQVQRNLDNAMRDFTIAKKDSILEVKFNYAYTALIKAGIALFSKYGVKVKSVPGHHIKIIEQLAQILNDTAVAGMGNVMRSKRNVDLYAGGIVVTEKECREYLKFVENILDKVKNCPDESV